MITVMSVEAHICQFLQSCRSDLSCLWHVGEAFICLLTAALRVGVQLQSCNVSVPAQSVNELRVWGPAEPRKGFVVNLGGTEPSQVAARGEVVVQRGHQRRLLVYLQQEAKLKGCRERGQTVGHHYRLSSGVPGNSQMTGLDAFNRE